MRATLTPISRDSRGYQRGGQLFRGAPLRAETGRWADRPTSHNGHYAQGFTFAQRPRSPKAARSQPPCSKPRSPRWPCTPANASTESVLPPPLRRRPTAIPRRNQRLVTRRQPEVRRRLVPLPRRRELVAERKCPKPGFCG